MTAKCYCGRPAHGVDGYCGEHDNPRAMPRAEKQPCLCSHHWVWHTTASGRCEISPCGCIRYRTDDTRRRMDEEMYDPSPEPVQRRPM